MFRRNARTFRKLDALSSTFDQATKCRGKRRHIVGRDQNAGLSGTVSGMAPAVVPITGNPCAIASA